PTTPTPFPYTTLFRSRGRRKSEKWQSGDALGSPAIPVGSHGHILLFRQQRGTPQGHIELAEERHEHRRDGEAERSAESQKRKQRDRKSTRLNSSHEWI